MMMTAFIEKPFKEEVEERCFTCSLLEAFVLCNTHSASSAAFSSFAEDTGLG